MKRYIALYKGKPLSYFYPNGNGKVKDIIGFTWKSYKLFESPEKIKIYLQNNWDSFSKRDGIENELLWKVNGVINKITIEEKTL